MAGEPNLLQQIIRKIELLSMYERESSHSQTFKRKTTRHHQQQLGVLRSVQAQIEVS